MKRKKLFVLLPALIASFLIVAGVAISGTKYTWEKTFEVTKPEIECEIEISDSRVVGCPVKIWVMLKLEDGCGRCWNENKEEWDDEYDDDWRDTCDKCEEHESEGESCCGINGTYSVDLHFWNETQEDWQHLTHLQEVNMTLTCWKHVETYAFTPTTEAEYKVVVAFTSATESLTFSNEG